MITAVAPTEFSDLPSERSNLRRLGVIACLAIGCFFAWRAMTPDAGATTLTSATVSLPNEAAASIVAVAAPVKPKTLTRSIEDIELGQRVVGRNPLRQETQSPSAIDPQSWRTVRLTMLYHGVEYDLAFLRSLEWLHSVNAQPGGNIHLSMPEMGLDGPATVTAIEQCPAIEPDDGTGRMVVTGTMAHIAGNILEIDATELEEPLGVTTTHPIWSETRQTFVMADDLQIGEELSTATGQIATITRITPKRGPPENVYNLEVDGEHVYHVASNGLLVHNDCGIARVTVGSQHAAVEVIAGGRKLATHVTADPEVAGKYWVRKVGEWLTGKGKRYVDVPLDDASAAMKYQDDIVDSIFKNYELGLNDCVTHVKNVLSAGGVDVSNLPNTVKELLKALEELPW